MKDWESVLISPSTTIIDAIKIIDTSAMQIALVVDDQKRLLGTVTDGDIRRGILKGIKLEQQVTSVMKEDPLTVGPEQNRDAILKIMKDSTPKRSL